MASDDDMTNYDQWTSCEVYGHQYAEVEGEPGLHRCTRCPDEYHN